MTIEDHTRRQFLAALSASGALAALVVPGMVAASSEASGSISGPALFRWNSGVDQTEAISFGRPEAFPAPTPGLRYSLVSGGQFQAFSDTVVFSKAPYLSATGGFFGVPLTMLPDGAVVSEVSFAILKGAINHNGNVYGSMTKYPPFDPGTPPILPFASADSTALGLSSNVQYVNLPSTGTVADRTIDSAGASTWLVARLEKNMLFDVRVGWVPPAAPLGFYPLAPKRVYDSRRPAGGGLLAGGSSRVVSVKDGYVNDTDTLDAPNIVPVGAKAIAYNVTIVGTTGAGYLSIGPGDATVAAGSAINWGAPDQVAANGLTVTLDASRQIKVFAGPGGGTQFLIDVMGYYA